MNWYDLGHALILGTVLAIFYFSYHNLEHMGEKHPYWFIAGLFFLIFAYQAMIRPCIYPL